MQGPLRGPSDFARDQAELDQIRKHQPRYWKVFQEPLEQAKERDEAYGRMLSAMRTAGTTAPLATLRFQLLSLAQPTAQRGVIVLPGRDVPVPASPRASVAQFLQEQGVPSEEVEPETLALMEREMGRLEKAATAARIRVIEAVFSAVRMGMADRKRGNFAVRDGDLLWARLEGDTEHEIIVEDAVRGSRALHTDLLDLFR